MKEIKADIVIIGAGSAGMSAFKEASVYNKDIYLIEKNTYGTTCAKVGCMPSKLLIAAADTVHKMNNSKSFGIHLSGDVIVNGKEVMKRVKAERDRFVGFVLEDIKQFPTDKKIIGEAIFIDNNTLKVDDSLLINFKQAIIATGSRPRVTKKYKDELKDKLIVNDDIFYWDDLPRSVAINGLGVIALEIGQALHRLGVRVHFFVRSNNFVSISDAIILQKAKEIFQEELNITFNIKINPKLKNNQVEIEYFKNQNKTVEYFDYLFEAAGRLPNIDNIGLENLDIKCDKLRVPIVNKFTMQTSIPNIFIAGDASNQLPLLHEASDQGKIAGKNSALYPNCIIGLRRSPIGIVFSDPNIAFVGNSFKFLQSTYKDSFDLNIVIGESSFVNQGRSRIMLVNKGHIRIYALANDGMFLGAEMIGPQIEHIAHLLSWAHQQKMTIMQMLDMPFYHPVIEEGLRSALRDAHYKLLNK